MDRGKRPHKNRERGKDIEKWQTDGQEGERKLGGREALEFEVTTVSKNFKLSFVRSPAHKNGEFLSCGYFFPFLLWHISKTFQTETALGGFLFSVFHITASLVKITCVRIIF